MCGAVLGSPVTCPACGEAVGKVRAGAKRNLLGMPVFEAFFVAIFLIMVSIVVIAPLLDWIRPLFRP